MPSESPSALDHFRDALAPDFRVERILGTGGTATVFLAEDTKHGRMVAVKVLRRELAETVGADRFIREIRVAARLTHPHIVPLLDSGRAGDSPYFVMPFIDGESLRTRLERMQFLPLDEAVALVIEVADALDYAHAAGLVHRDIKPENVLILGGHAVVADFGIARALVRPADAPGTTSVGLVLGTPAYMSPEQAAGEAEIDGRSDIYSLATMLFELVSGALPFSAPTTSGLIAKRFMERAPSLATVMTGVPERIAEAVAAALALDPADRPATAKAFARLLRAPTTDGPSAVPTGVHSTSSRPPVHGTISNPAMPSVVVLPFANLSADPDNEFLSDGITEEVMNTLSRLRTIRVAARASSFAFKERRGDVREFAEKLGVTHVLDGSVRRAATRVRVSAQLVDARTGFQLWSDQIDRPFDDAFAIQDEIAGAISAALSATLLRENALPHAPRDRVAGAAYELYLRGRFALNKRTESDLRSAVRLFEEAAQQQDDFALAYAGLGDALLLLGVYGAEPPVDVMPRARAAAERAREIDPSLGEAYVTLGAIRALHDWDWAGADDAFGRAIALSPRYPTAWQWRAMNQFLPLGRFDEARAAIDRARGLDPLATVIATSVGVVYHLAGDTAGAAQVLREAAKADPAFAMTHYFLGGALRDAGELAEAAAAFRMAIARSGGTPEMTAGLAQVYAAKGDPEGARGLQSEIRESARTRNVSPCLIAQVHASLGEVNDAMLALERAAASRDPELVFLGVRPAYAPLRDDARFRALRARIGV